MNPINGIQNFLPLKGLCRPYFGIFQWRFRHKPPLNHPDSLIFVSINRIHLEFSDFPTFSYFNPPYYVAYCDFGLQLLTRLICFRISWSYVRTISDKRVRVIEELSLLKILGKGRVKKNNKNSSVAVGLICSELGKNAYFFD